MGACPMSNFLRTRFIPIWKQAPFLRLLPPFIAGIITRYYLPLSTNMLTGISAAAALLFLIIHYSSLQKTKKWALANHLLLFIAGCWLVTLHTLPHNSISRHYHEGQMVKAILQEPPLAKAKSIKAEASVQLIDSNHQLLSVNGNIIVYLQKDSTQTALDYGSEIIFRKPLQPIRNAGNPGGFNYQRYAAFHGLFYQVYLKKNEYIISKQQEKNSVQKALFTTRNFVLQTFKQRIATARESAVAEALLVGYRNDLDKDLVEQYANTGVVHIIAISGMHLGMIYLLMMLLLQPLKRLRRGLVLQAMVIIAALWFFTFLTGAAPSITRSALMFSVIAVGNCFGKRSSIYNSLAISAFLLLLIQPFHLWDVGFQLSYAAVLSIAVFGNTITNWIFISNKYLKPLWQLVAITLAAQILTLPLVLYHFHQFPLLFLAANLVAVPLSTFILYALLVLLCFSWWPWFAEILGRALGYTIKWMNDYIGWIDSIPSSRLGNIYYTLPQALVLTLLIAALAWWLLRRSSAGLAAASLCLLSLLLLRARQFYQTSRQQKIIVYNVPQQQAIDIISGRHYQFIGDSILAQKGFLQNFHLQPSRILHQAVWAGNLPLSSGHFTRLQLGKQSLLLIDKPLLLKDSDTCYADYVVISHAIKMPPQKLLQKIRCRNIVLDGSNSPWRIQQWKIAADSLHLHLHSVAEQGAFVLDF